MIQKKNLSIFFNNDYILLHNLVLLHKYNETFV